MPEYTALSSIFLALFYVDDGYIASTDLELLQESMDVLIALFMRVGNKMKAETCIEGKIRTWLSTRMHSYAKWRRNQEGVGG
eukprot:scaffold2510_cov215-Alexandrium_tamarense.AAC.13